MTTPLPAAFTVDTLLMPNCNSTICVPQQKPRHIRPGYTLPHPQSSAAQFWWAHFSLTFLVLADKSESSFKSFDTVLHLPSRSGMMWILRWLWECYQSYWSLPESLNVSGLSLQDVSPGKNIFFQRDPPVTNAPAPQSSPPIPPRGWWWPDINTHTKKKRNIFLQLMKIRSPVSQIVKIFPKINLKTISCGFKH